MSAEGWECLRWESAAHAKCRSFSSREKHVGPCSSLAGQPGPVGKIQAQYETLSGGKIKKSGERVRKTPRVDLRPLHTCEHRHKQALMENLFWWLCHFLSCPSAEVRGPEAPVLMAHSQHMAVPAQLMATVGFAELLP